MSFLGYNQFTATVDGDNDSDLIYYNATIINNRTQTLNAQTDVDPIIRFQDTRDVPIVADASKYQLSIVRFTMNGPSLDLPLFIPSIRTGLANPTQNVNLTIHSINLTLAVNYTTVSNPVVATLSSTQPILWTPQVTSLLYAPVPSPSTTQTGQDLSSRYYWCSSYEHWLLCVNTAFEAALAQLQIQFQTAWTAAGNAGTAPALKTAVPSLQYEAGGGLFKLYADRQSSGGAARTLAGSSTDENLSIYFNNNLYGMFSSFDAQYVNLDSERTYQLMVRNQAYQNIVNVASPPAPAALSYWVMTQDYNSTSTLWSPVDAIVFTSTMLPIISEFTGPLTRYGQGNDNQLNDTQRNFEPIITDIAVGMQVAHNYREFIEYSPQAEYRMTAFQRAKQPINVVDLQVYWRNRLDGRLYPLRMYNASSVSIKMMFRRRGINSYPHPAQYGVDA